tara:strand:+ start:666 stop:1844 length:1179 start_codon:yes stop_codon:yes gene_type:complete
LSQTFYFDPFDAQFFNDPYPSYQTMRREYPVFKCEIDNYRVWPHYWIISRGSDVKKALADWETFSSARGTLIDVDISLIPVNIFNMDPPRHDALREILGRVLTAKKIVDMEPLIRHHAQLLINRFKERGQAEIVSEYAHLIPTYTMCELLGLPQKDQKKFLKWNLDTLAGADFTSKVALKAYAEMEAYWKDLVIERRKNKTSDLISQILHAQVKGEELSNEEIVGFVSLLHDASQNTTMNMISNSIIALAYHPDQAEMLVENPELWPNAVEELLRYISPVQGLARCTTRDVEICGVTIPKGDQVLLMYGSANHDEYDYIKPNQLDISRPIKSHRAFGHGIHHCLGQAVAKLEARVALQLLLENLGQWQIDEDSVVRNQLVPTRGVAAAKIYF